MLLLQRTRNEWQTKWPYVHVLRVLRGGRLPEHLRIGYAFADERHLCDSFSFGLETRNADREPNEERMAYSLWRII